MANNELVIKISGDSKDFVEKVKSIQDEIKKVQILQ